MREIINPPPLPPIADPYKPNAFSAACDATFLVVKGRHTRVEGTVVQRHRKNELVRATREILESSRIGCRIIRRARGNKGKGKGQGEYRSERIQIRAKNIVAGVTCGHWAVLLDLTATTLCADRPLLLKLGSAYRSQLARMRPRFDRWELESKGSKRMRQVTCLAGPK